MNYEIVIHVGGLQGAVLICLMSAIVLLDSVLIWQRYKMRKLMDELRRKKGR